MRHYTAKSIYRYSVDLKFIHCININLLTFALYSLKALILKLKDPDPNPGVVISVLATIGELAQVRLDFMYSLLNSLFITLSLFDQFKTEGMQNICALCSKCLIALWFSCLLPIR